MTIDHCAQLPKELDKVTADYWDDPTYRQEWDIRYEYNGALWCVDVLEADDHHHFVRGVGPTTDDAAKMAIENIPDAAEFWGWQYDVV